MQAELSVPVIWVEDDGAPLPGRVDLHADHVHLDGGSREDRRLRDVRWSEIASVHIGRNGHDRIGGRRPVVLSLHDGHTLAFVAFDRPGAMLELAHRLEERI